MIIVHIALLRFKNWIYDLLVFEVLHWVNLKTKQMKFQWIFLRMS